MVDCVTYEEIDLDKCRAEAMVLPYLDENGQYDINSFFDSEKKSQKPFFLTKEQILNPEFDNYVILREMLYSIKQNRPDQIGGIKYNTLLMILAAMTDCVTASEMEAWESSPKLQFLNKNA